MGIDYSLDNTKTTRHEEWYARTSCQNGLAGSIENHSEQWVQWIDSSDC